MLRIGLTGGIASGKSTVADLFAAHGASILDTDVIAREVVVPGSRALAELVAAQGGGILDAEGRLDRAELRRRIFADPAAPPEGRGNPAPGDPRGARAPVRAVARPLPGAW